MENLHAPWRIEYLRAPRKDAGGDSTPSLFCRIAQADDDIAHHVIVRDRTCYALLNTYPYNGGHILVVPYKQAADLPELTDGELTDLMLLSRRCQAALREVMKPDGFNIGINIGKAAGAGITSHLHLHIVPRWNGDTNFMPVLAHTGVVPEALTEVAQKLRTVLARH